MSSTSGIARGIVAGIAALGIVAASLVGAEAAYAADTVTLTPATSTVASNTPVTYTLTVSCSTTGGCANSTVTIPTTSITGDGATSDISSWITNGNCPTMTKPAGKVSFAFGTMATGTSSCTFTVRPPDKTTLNGAAATLTPTFTNTAGSSTGAAAVLNATAGHNDSLGGGATASVFTGGPMTLTFTMSCGIGTGDLGLSALNLSDVLPSNFTFTSLSTAPVALQGTIHKPAVGTAGGTITYSGDGSDCLNPTNDRVVFIVNGTAAANGTGDAVGSTICHTPTSTFTYIDGFVSTSTPGQKCGTVVDINWVATKNVTAKTLGNLGQYKALDGTTPAKYTFPGDWDSSGGDTDYVFTASTKPVTTASGLSYDMKDPLPCIDNVSGAKYLSNAPGVACAHPAYVPKTVTVAGFTPTAADKITVLYANGTTGSVAYVSGTGWSLPTSPVISEIDIPAFTEEGNNTFATMTFTVTGYAAATAVPGHIMTNTETAQAYFSGTTVAVKTPQLPSTSILVADPAAAAGGALAFPSLTATYSGGCVDHVTLNSTTNGNLRNQLEFDQGTSKAIYIDYLSPANVGTITAPLTFTLTGQNGHTYTSGSITPVQTANYNGTGRTLVVWTIPAGLAAVPGLYILSSTAFNVNLPAGCAGVYRNTMTLGYAAAIPECIYAASVQAPPAAASGDAELDTNGSSIAGNYCGYASPFTVTATNPGFSVGKQVQGNLDASPIGAGGVGKVSPTGGSATYDVTFTNTGQSNLHDPVMYDLLPRVGDTEATSTVARGSQFAVQLTDVPTPPAGVSIEYSQAANPCRPEILANASNPGCVNDWSATAPSPLSDTTALRIAYSGTVGVNGSPFEQSFSVSYSVSTPDLTVGAEAWNTVGTNAHLGDTGDDDSTDDPFLGAAESSKTGLTASTNSPGIVKGATQATYSAVGDEIDYTFDVTNTEAVPLISTSVVDSFTDAPSGEASPTVTCESLSNPTDTCSGANTPLLPGQVAHFVATYNVTQADIDHGRLSDSAIVTGQPAAGAPISNSSNVVTVRAVTDSSLSIVKSTTETSVENIGDTVPYDFLLTNTGNQTLHGLSVNDPMLASVTCPVNILAPAASTTCTGTYSVTQADLDAGSISNTATGSALAPGNGSVVSGPSTATVAAVQLPHLTLTKSVSPASVAEVGDRVTFHFAVVNDGNVTLDNVAVNEGAFTGSGTLSAVSCPGTTLAPSGTIDCTATYAVTQADLDTGSISNTATASADAPQGSTVTSDGSTAVVAIASSAALSLSKTADVAKITTVGQNVTYSFEIKNIGNVTVTNVIVQESSFTGTGALSAVDCPAGVASMAPGDDLRCTATYSVTAADLRSGTLSNTAVASGTGGNVTVLSPDSTAAVIADPPVVPPVVPPGVPPVVPPVLGFTGADPTGGLILAVILFAAGGLVLLIRRRRKA
ncbi:MAG TPA: hypothetical protein VGM94_10635 [Galbitalea sp.]|jgi:uncharacterized repeat protein (TIGR01451 family)